METRDHSAGHAFNDKQIVEWSENREHQGLAVILSVIFFIIHALLKAGVYVHFLKFRQTR